MAYSLNIRGSLLEFSRPQVMGIINVTPDSFFAGSRLYYGDVVPTVGKMIRDGADMIDIGGYSTRPGAPEVSAEEELRRLIPAISRIRSEFREVIISVDTFRADVARKSVEAGADIINDISGGDLDPKMFDVVTDLKVPYILMHTRGTPADMQRHTDYDDVAAVVLRSLVFKVDALRQRGLCDIIVDPGIGFAKTTDQNYQVLASLPAYKALGAPLLIGLSRKTLIWKELGITPGKSLPGTTALNMLSLINGADILRVHDVKEAAQTVRLYEAYRRNLGATRTVTVSDIHGASSLDIYRL